jgi:chromosome segregation protein
VRDLFMDTGMGSHAYSVIERQMVDNILSDTTGHRRFLFEEAAGIMKYKTRKKEALAKLEATERDLLRVNDIISEVERQVHSLKRQVGRAERYRELLDEIRGLDLAWSRRRRREWKEELAVLGARHAETLRSAEAGETQVATLEARLAELRLAVLETERALGEAREFLAQAADEIGRRNSRILVLRERMEAARLRIQEAAEHQVRLADRKERNVQSAEEIEEKIVALTGRGGVERAEREARESVLRDVETLVRELRERVAGERRNFDDRRENLVRAEGAAEAAAGRLLETEARMVARNGRLEIGRVERGARAAAVASLHERMESARGRLGELEEDGRVLETRQENHRSRFELLRKSLSGKQAEEAAARSRMGTLEDLKARYEGYVPGVRALMLEAERDPGVHGTVGDLVSLPHAWRDALEPVLSQVWQVLVVEDTATARRLVRRLGQESLGFAAFVALDRVPERPMRVGNTAWAAEVVEVDDRHRGLVRYLLDGLALVPDLDTALRVVGDGTALRAATAAGEIVDAALISGGSGGPQGAELVEREEALARCRRNLDSLVHALGDMMRHEEELLGEKRELEKMSLALVSGLDAARKALAGLEREEAGEAQAFRHAEGTLGALEEEGIALDGLHADITRERTGLRVRVDEARTEVARLQAGLAEREVELARAEAERESVLAAVHDARLVCATLEADLRDAHAAAQRLVRERTDLEEEWTRTVRDEADARELVVQTEQDVVLLAQEVQELNVVLDERGRVVAERDGEKAEAVAREQIDADTLREVRRTAGRSRQEAHEFELRLHDLNGEVKHLEERLHAEYELAEGALEEESETPIPEGASERLTELKERLRRLGPVNLLAMEEYQEKSQRFEFMSTQCEDLVRAKDSLMKTIEEINKTASGMFLDTFSKVQENFQRTFQVLFQGGECSLQLTGDDPLEADIEVMAKPRGKKPQNIAQLSSGERALTAIALLFAIYLVKPSPFCILDEVDAPLDDANIDRFVAMVKEFSNRTQFIVITHNKKTMEAADCLYGVTMQRPGVSSVISVELNGVRAAKRPGKGAGNGHGEGDSPREEDPLSPESVIAQ